MKKKLNVIQIKGIKGLFIAAFVLCCLLAGFVALPGLVGMYLWKYITNFVDNMPTIGLIQGILLWGIIAFSYFLFRKDKVVVCMQAPQGLSDEELKAVFADIKKQSLEDPILQSMLKARESEFKYKKAQQELEKDSETVSNVDNTKV